MRVLLLGPGGGIGREVRERATAAGHELVLFTRDAAALEPLASTESAIQGDLRDSDAIAAAVRGVDAVISAVGPTSNDRDEVALFAQYGAALVEAMESAGVKRLITISGGACTLPGEHKPLRARVAGRIVRLFVANVVKAKQLELDAVVASGLDWTAPRPPRVVEGEATGHIRVGDVEQGLRITQGDLAAFMVEQLTSDTHVRRAPYVSN